jgi:hypothetical protein
MKLKKHIFIFTLATLFLLNISLFAQTNAKSTVEKFYQFHNSRNGVLSLHELKSHKRFFTNDLYKLFLNELKREDEFIRKNNTDKPHFGDGLPFKPFEECVVDEKIYRNTYEVNEASVDGNIAIVEVKFYQPKQCDGELIDTYKIELKKSNNTWLINDWFFSDETKLTNDLKRKDY